MPEDKKGAIVQRDGRTYAIVPRTPVGLLTPEQLETIAAVARKHSIPVIKITSGQRLALVGMTEEQIEDVWRDLGIQQGRATELCLHYVQACPGDTVCRFGVQDSLGLGTELESLFSDIDLPAKMKIGVSGCPLCCGESFVRDIGLFAKKSGWTLIVGGSSARRPRIGDIVAQDLPKEAAVDLVRKVFGYYRDNGKSRERMAQFVNRIGIDAMKEALLK
ncbi:MAG: NAD(P)/FAD-dependent oxidoreductase [Spirochaetes bacterium]|nr:NAD(P)/FAD-dependent oxidoreductase [Spirochaetota bacterium]